MTVSESLTDICKEINNWYDRRQRHFGTFTIKFGNLLNFEDKLKPGQFYRVIGSTFHDGVHLYTRNADGTFYPEPGAETESPRPSAFNETFDGAIWPMFVPPNIIRLAKDVAAWRELYENAESPALSPFAMESHGGYAYQMRGGMTDAGNGVITWQSVFAARLNAERKF